MRRDIFAECRKRVSAEDAARCYGLTINARGWAICPFHPDKHPSMSFKNGRYKCWACNASGDSIDFAARLYGLETVEAVRRLDSDFHLSLPLDKPLTPAERREAAVEARRRQQLQETSQEFEAWQRDMLNQLSAAFREGQIALKSIVAPEDMGKLTEAQIMAIQWQATFEHWWEILAYGDMAEKMTIFRDRKGVGERCKRILKNMPQRSSAA